MVGWERCAPEKRRIRTLLNFLSLNHEVSLQKAVAAKRGGAMIITGSMQRAIDFGVDCDYIEGGFDDGNLLRSLAEPMLLCRRPLTHRYPVGPNVGRSESTTGFGEAS
jgi:hypothetical protein